MPPGRELKEKPDVRASQWQNAAFGHEGCSENPQEYLQMATRLLLSESGRQPVAALCFVESDVHAQVCHQLPSSTLCP